MYKKALQELISKATEEFFKEHTEYKKTSCYKVELKNNHSIIEFTAHLVATDNDPQLGEWFTLEGYLCYHINFTKIINTFEKKVIFNIFA